MSRENPLKYSNNYNVCLGTIDKSIKEAVIKEGCKRIEIESFSRCHFLEKIYLPSTIESIGMFAFNECLNLKEINLENTKVKVLYPGIFQNCKKLEKIYLPDTLEEVDRLFFLNTKIEELILPKNIKKIKDYFLKESNVKKIVLPDNIYEINSHAFDSNALQIIIHGKQNDMVMNMLEKLSREKGIKLAESNLDFLISNKSFKEINNIYKEKEIEI